MTQAFEKERTESRVDFNKQITHQSREAGRQLEELRKALTEGFRKQQDVLQEQMNATVRQLADQHRIELDNVRLMQSRIGQDGSDAVRAHQQSCEEE